MVSHDIRRKVSISSNALGRLDFDKRCGSAMIRSGITEADRDRDRPEVGGNVLSSMPSPSAEEPGTAELRPHGDGSASPLAVSDVSVADGAPIATRQDLQLGRRLFHMLNGVAVATAYALLFTHEQVVHIFGTIACLVYIGDRVRIAYPEFIARRAAWLNRWFVRAEEQVRESAMIPYVIAILLTMITAPKPAALIAIYTLAIADPLAAMVGIRWGRHRLVQNRSLEGTLAFFFANLVIVLLVLGWHGTVAPLDLTAAATSIALSAAVTEVIPLRIDDNLTIPLFVAFLAWGIATVFGIPLS